MATVTGTDGNDIIVPGFSSPGVAGIAGDGDDVIAAGDGNDTVYGGGGNDSIHGGEGFDVDVLSGDAGDDTLDGGAGSDVLAGGAGNDTYVTDDPYFEDSIIEDAGQGFDSVRAGRSFTLTANLEALELLGTEELNGFGNAAGNRITGNAGANILRGEAGDDTIGGGDGDDLLDGGAGRDRLDGGIGNDLLQAGDGDDTLDGGTGDDVLGGGAGNDALAGGEGADALVGEAGNDRLAGGAGADTLRGGDGRDSLEGGDDGDALTGDGGDALLDGGAGDDRVTLSLTGAQFAALGVAEREALRSFVESPSGHVLTLPGGPTIRNVEQVELLVDGVPPVFDRYTLTPGNDRFVGNDRDETVTALAGSDTVDGGGGNDDLFGDDGDDSLTGNAGDDSLSGGAGNDTLTGGFGLDVIDGGEGIDTISFTGEGAAAIDMAAGRATIGGSVETFTGIEHALGSGGNDTITGSTSADSLAGGGGDDQVSGGGGNDTLSGGAGHDRLLGGDNDDRIEGGDGDDTLQGGAGKDSFVFSGAFGFDVVEDFERGQDVLSFARSLVPAFEALDSSGNGILDDADDDVSIVLGSTVITLPTGQIVVRGTVGLTGDDFSRQINGINVGGGPGNDALSGTDRDDVLRGLGGNDTLSGGPGWDALYGGDGNDSLIGGTGADLFSGGNGTDTVDFSFTLGGGTIDLMNGIARTFDRFGTEIVEVLQDVENIVGTRRSCTIIGDNGDNLLRASADGAGRHTLLGNGGNDTLVGSWHYDLLDGGSGDDFLIGGMAGDTLIGGDGNDTLDGGTGSPLAVGTGNNVLTGGADADVFVIQGHAVTRCDRITDFAQGTDLVRLGSNFASNYAVLDSNGNGVLDDPDAQVRIIGGDTYILFNASTRLTFDNVVGLTADDFVFV